MLAPRPAMGAAFSASGSAWPAFWLPVVGEPGVAAGGQDQDRLAVRVALLGVVEPRAGGQVGGRKPQPPIGVVHGSAPVPCRHNGAIYGQLPKSVFPSFGRFLLLALFMGVIGGYDHRRPRSRHVMAGH
jgi:hypothetical protein